MRLDIPRRVDICNRRLASRCYCSSVTTISLSATWTATLAAMPTAMPTAVPTCAGGGGAAASSDGESDFQRAKREHAERKAAVRKAEAQAARIEAKPHGLTASMEGMNTLAKILSKKKQQLQRKKAQQEASGSPAAATDEGARQLMVAFIVYTTATIGGLVLVALLALYLHTVRRVARRNGVSVLTLLRGSLRRWHEATSSVRADTATLAQQCVAAVTLALCSDGLGVEDTGATVEDIQDRVPSSAPQSPLSYPEYERTPQPQVASAALAPGPASAGMDQPQSGWARRRTSTASCSGTRRVIKVALASESRSAKRHTKRRSCGSTRLGQAGQREREKS